MCNSRGFFFFRFCFVSSSLSASLSPRVVLALHITPDTTGRACKIQRAALQTSRNLLCVYSNNFNPWLFTEQLQRCVWLWLKVFSVEKRTERSQIKSLCYCGVFFFFFLRSTFFFFSYLDTLDFFFVSETAGRLPANTDRSKLFISGKWERVEDESCPCLIYCALVSFWGYQIESARIQQHIKLNICRTDSNLITKLFQFH